MILTRVLSKENFGTLAFLLQAYMTIVTLAHLGLPESVFYFFDRIPRDSRKAFALLTGRNLFLIGIGGAVILTILNFLAPLWGFKISGMILPFIFLVLIELPTLPLPNILIAIDKVKQAGGLNLAIGLLQFSALIIPAILGQPLQVIAYCVLFYGVCRFGLSAFLFFRNFKGPAGALPKGMTKEQFKYSVPVGISQILWGLNREIDKFIVAAFLPVVVYAEYLIGAREIPFLPAIVYSVGAVMMPQLVSFHHKGQKKELLALWNKSIRKMSVIILPLAILFLVIAEEFIVLLFTEEFSAAALPFRIYTLIILHRVASYSSILKAIGETRAITYSAICLVVINVVLSIPLVILLGMAGPPLATLLANMVTWVYVLNKIKNSLAVSFPEVFPLKFYLRALLTAAIPAVPIYYFKNQLLVSIEIKLILAAAGFLLVYFFAARFSGLIAKGELPQLLKSLKS